MERLKWIARALAEVVRRPGIFLARKRYILLLSHMRSYTTLLAHILGSHPQVTGYTEMHMSYLSSWDLIQLKLKVTLTSGQALRTRYVLDKVLHNLWVVSSQVLSRPYVFPVFTIRRPQETLPSILAMSAESHLTAWARTPKAAAEYYCGRLEHLAVMAESCRRPAFFFRAEDLVEKSPLVLTSLQRYLHLRVPLSEHYQTFEYTGTDGFGDTSARVFEGRISHQRRRRAPLEIEPALLEACQSTYQDTCERLLRVCLTPETMPDKIRRGWFARPKRLSTS